MNLDKGNETRQVLVSREHHILLRKKAAEKEKTIRKLLEGILESKEVLELDQNVIDK